MEWASFAYGPFHFGLVYPTEIRTSISPSSVVWLNTTSALANYATEAGYVYFLLGAWMYVAVLNIMHCAMFKAHELVVKIKEMAETSSIEDWDQLYKKLKEKHDKAYFIIDEAIRLEEESKKEEEGGVMSDRRLTEVSCTTDVTTTNV
ncbi:unnamed protein product [Timema podura]|uniref:Uncharacterized protein n=1 Tax=Timema podura TaxID=61482 RepID=A0ABN7NGC7_TIMPD|nr:unnamed protein product [Timema podura]